MSKLSLTQKTTRVLRLLLGLRNPQIAGTLVEHGLGNKDLEEGWRLLREAVGARLDRVTPPQSPPGKVEQLDEFENRWFPIASASLQRAYPEVNEKLFLNLSQTVGDEVIVSVSTFIDRVEALGTSDDGSVDRAGQMARALLTRRGLTDEVIAKAKQLLSDLEAQATADELAATPDPAIIEHQLEAEKALWSWYLEWSAISRAVIKNRNHLRQLGFLQKSVVDERAEASDGAGATTSDTAPTAPTEPEEAPIPTPPETNDTTPVVNA